MNQQTHNKQTPVVQTIKEQIIGLPKREQRALLVFIGSILEGREIVSNCCSAPVMEEPFDGVCSNCKEHCVPVLTEE
jgi:hypothetical protein